MQCLEHGAERFALFGKEVLIAGRMVLVEAGGDDAVTLERLEPRRQRVGREARKPLLKLLKPQRSFAEEIAQHEQRPLLADHIERPGNRAILSIAICHDR